MPTTVVKTIKPAGGGDYASLATWEATENGDLVTADEIRVAECYAGNCGTVTMAGWTVDSTRYPIIRAAASDRHTGVYSTGVARIEGGIIGPSGHVNIDVNYTRLEGMIVYVTGNDSSQVNVHVGGAIETRVSHCLLRGRGTGTGLGGCKGWYAGADIGGSQYLWNCIIYDMGSPDGTGNKGAHELNHTAGKSYVYNVTVHSVDTGFHSEGSDMVAKNCLATNTDTADFAGTFSAGTVNNASQDTTAPGTSSRVSQTFSFVDDANDNFLLASGDVGAKDFGADLSADGNNAFSTDILFATRSGSWDIGAHEFVAGGGGSAAHYSQDDMAGGMAGGMG